MSFLGTVLHVAEKVAVEEVKAKIPLVTDAVSASRSEVISYLEDVYVKFRERPKHNRKLAAKLIHLSDEVATLNSNMEQVTKKELAKSETATNNLLEALDKVNVALKLIGNFHKVHESLLEIRELQENDSYLMCMIKILDADELVLGFPRNHNLPVMEDLIQSIYAEKCQLLNKLSNVFEDSVVLKTDALSNSIKISNKNIEEVLSALYLDGTSITPLDKTTKFLWEHIFTPVIDFVTKIKVGDSNSFATMEVIVVDSTKKSSYSEVFANIKTILEFLRNNFIYQLGEDMTTLRYIGRDIRDNLSELIIKHCLQDTIPSTAEGLKNYKIVIEETEKLERALVEAEIFTEETMSILEYANNIDILFINKKCQNYLETARDLMKKDLHDMVEVGVAQTDTLEVSNDFPKCSVSRSVIEIIEMASKMLLEATTASEMCAGRLYCTVKNIFVIYGKFVPEHHKKLLQTIPQQIALFYNNCAYISFKIIEFNEVFIKKLPATLEVGFEGFNLEGNQLETIASTMFTSYIATQINQIQEIMKDSGFQTHQTLEQLEPALEKCLRQCLRQEELLKTVWCKVLPYSLYNKSLGSILNSLVNYLVGCVVKFEDISTNAAEQLVELLKMVVTRGPKLFTEPKEVNLFVESWHKLNELVFVLSASLVEINDRWASGKGPLALQFKPTELRQLVRALFQNTEKRAALLNRIHD